MDVPGGMVEREEDEGIAFEDSGVGEVEKLEVLETKEGRKPELVRVDVNRKGWKVAYKYSRTNAQRRWKSYARDVFVIGMVTFVIMVLRGVSSKTPLIFVSFSENLVGEGDVQMAPSGGVTTLNEEVRKANVCGCGEDSQGLFIATSSMRQYLDQIANSSSVMSGYVSRTILLGKTMRKDRLGNETGILTVVLFYDHEEEEVVNLGKVWSRRMLGEQEAYGTTELLSLLGLRGSAGDRAMVDMDSQLIRGLIEKFVNSQEGTFAFLNTELVFFTRDETKFIAFYLSNIDGERAVLEDWLRDHPDYDPLVTAQGFEIVLVEGNLVIVGPAGAFVELLYDSAGGGQLTAEVTINEDVIPQGKWASTLGNVLSFESRHFQSFVKNILNNLVLQVSTSPNSVRGCVETLSGALLNGTLLADAPPLDPSLELPIIPPNIFDDFSIQDLLDISDFLSDVLQEQLIGFPNVTLRHSVDERSNAAQRGILLDSFRSEISKSLRDGDRKDATSLNSSSREDFEHGENKFPPISARQGLIPDYDYYYDDDYDDDYDYDDEDGESPGEEKDPIPEESPEVEEPDNPFEDPDNPIGQVTEDCLSLLVRETLFDVLRNATEDLDVSDLATSLVFIHKKRTGAYANGLKNARRELRRLSDEVSTAIGIDYPSNFTTAVYEDLEENEFLLILLDQIFFIVFVCVFVLGAVLLFAMTYFEVEMRSYEYGMLRTLGLKPKELWMILFGNSLLTAIPGFLFGLIASIPALLLVDVIIQRLTGFEISSEFNGELVIVAALAGFVIPMAAQTLPYRGSFSKNLSVAIDVSRSKISELEVLWNNPRKFYIDKIGVFIGVMLLAYGGVFFFGIPRSFNNDNLAVFFGLLNVILVTMLFSLSTIVQILQPLLEKIIAYVIIPFKVPDSKLRFLVLRNLYSHRLRSRSCSIMFNLSIAFLIFSGALVQQQMNSIKRFAYIFNGADVHAFSVTDQLLNRETLDPVLDDLVNREIVADYSYITPPIRVDQGQILGEYVGVKMYGLQDNFFSVVFPQTVRVDQAAAPVESVGNLDDFLIRDSGVVPPFFGDSPYKQTLPSILSGRNEENDAEPIYTILATAMDTELSINPSVPSSVEMADDSIVMSHSTVLLTGVSYTSNQVTCYAAIVGATPVLTSEATFERFLAVEGSEVQPGDKAELLIKVVGDTVEQKRENSNVAARLMQSSQDDDFVISNVYLLLDSLSDVERSFYSFFIIVAIAAIFFSVIIMWSTVASNVRQSLLELAMERSIGFTEWQLIRAFVYESICHVLAAALLGTVSGSLVALTLALTYSTLEERYIGIQFPVAAYFFGVGLCFITSVIVPIVMMKYSFRKGIAPTLRST